MSNSWWEIKIVCDPNLEDIFFWRLEKFGCRGTSYEHLGQSLLVKGYLPQIEAEFLDLAALGLWLRQDAILMGLTEPKVHWHLIDEEDWASSWKEYWQPTEIGERFLIYPAWLEPPHETEKLILRLDPGAAFGTGVHPTTQLCLESLEMRISGEQKNLVIADIGCGSGILAIGAILLGANQVYAVDLDPLAVHAARNNRSLNNITPQQMAVKKGSVEALAELVSEGFDGFLCNILANVIVDLMPQITALSKPNSWAILSGILLDQSQDVAQAAEKEGWTISTMWKRKEWACLNIRRIE